MATLASATLDLARTLPGWNVVEGAATGGSTTTLVDANFPWLVDGTNPPADDYYNGGTVWFLTGDLAGKSALVTDWARATKTATFGTQTHAVAAGVQYAIVPKDYPLFILRQRVNLALSRIGNVDQRSTSLTTVTNQQSYTLPAGVSNVKRVEIARTTAAPYAYGVHHQWREIGGALEFMEAYQPSETGHIIRLTYAAPLARLDEDADTIPDLIHPELVRWWSVYEALRWKVGRTDAGDKAAVQALNEGIAMAEQEARRRMRDTEQTPRDSQGSMWATTASSPLESDPNLARY